MTGGCTLTTGRTSVEQADPHTPQHSATCTACSPDYGYNFRTKTCVCAEDEFLVTRLCTTVAGCLTTRQNGM